MDNGGRWDLYDRMCMALLFKDKACKIYMFPTEGSISDGYKYITNLIAHVRFT